MKYLTIVQGVGEVVLNVDGDIIHIELDSRFNIPTPAHSSLDDGITCAYPITYDNLKGMVLDLYHTNSSNLLPGKLLAIKAVRRLFYPMGLREAKSIVENIIEKDAERLLHDEHSS